MNDFLKKTGAVSLAALMCAAAPISTIPVFADQTHGQTSAAGTNNTATRKDLADNDIIDYSKKGSLTIHKYDITAATAAGDYTAGERIANGEKDKTLEEKMKDYAMEGVQFTYLRVGNIEMYSNTHDGATDVEVVYEIPEKLADILGLSKETSIKHDGENKTKAYDMNAKGVAEKCTNKGVYHYTSTQLNDALEKILEADNLGAKSKLEEYLYSYGTQDSTQDQSTNTDGTTGVKAVNMPKTDANGVTSADGLELGLYLLVETEVPEQATDTTNPWFVSLPFTNITSHDETVSQEKTQAGGDFWLYNMDVYPKNQTGNPTLDKSVRNAYSGTGVTNADGKLDKNGVVNAGKDYDYDVKSGNGNLVVYNKDTNAGNGADKDDAAYIANRGGYTKDGTTAGKDGAGYSVDFQYRDTTTASAGDVLDYILVSKLPHITSKSTFLSEYTFTDVLSGGISYNKDDVKIAFYDNADDANANNTANAVTIWDASSKNKVNNYVDISVSDGAAGHKYKNGSQQMTVSMTEEGLKTINGEGKNGENIAHQGAGQVSNNSYSDMYMVVYYTAKVNSNKSLVLGDNGNPNDVILQWSRTADGYYNTLTDRNYVYAYSLDLTKTFSDNKGDMSKVKFKLYNSTDAYYVVAKKADDGVYYVTGKTANKEDATAFTPGDDGKFVVYGLEADTYAMTEISTDNGYTLLEDSVITTIKATDREINASVAGTTGMDQAAIDAIVNWYHGGIRDENGDLVTESKNQVQGTDANRPNVETANGRTIGKTDMYEGPIKPATATVDKVDAQMKAHTYTQGELPDEHTSDNATVVLSVVNNKNFTLPKTGGYGTIIFTLAGCAVALGGVMVVTKKSKKRTSEK